MARKNPVTSVARQRFAVSDEPVVLSTGVRVIIRPVPHSIIDDTMSRVEDPAPPEVYIADKDVTELNYLDPGYLKALDTVNVKRSMAANDALLMFGVELVDGVPEGDEWLKRLKYAAKKGMVKLGDYDLEDELDRELVYKKYVAAAAPDIIVIARATGMSQEEVAEAASTFRAIEE
jgi:hypothetical protein